MSSPEPLESPAALTPQEMQARIEAAFERCAEIDTRRIKVTVADGRVRLTGYVCSWNARQEARHAAWAAPGVLAVEDRLAVRGPDTPVGRPDGRGKSAAFSAILQRACWRP